jgi:Ca2+-dependent lipid-binding protein
VTDTLNPIWNQTFDFMVEDALHDLLMVEVWDHDTFGKVHSLSLSLSLLHIVCSFEI